MPWLTIASLLACSLLFTLSSAEAQTGYDTRYFEPPGAQAPVWSPADEAWLERNRSFALAGKILTVIGVASVVVGAAAGQEIGVWGSGLVIETLGQYMWSIAELRGAKELRRRGVYVPKAAGIAAVIGAVVYSPVTWIAGPVQSARIREARELLPPYGSSAARSTGDRLSSFGFGLRLAF